MTKGGNMRRRQLQSPERTISVATYTTRTRDINCSRVYSSLTTLHGSNWNARHPFFLSAPQAVEASVPVEWESITSLRQATACGQVWFSAYSTAYGFAARWQNKAMKRCSRVDIISSWFGTKTSGLSGLPTPYAAAKYYCWQDLQMRTDTCLTCWHAR